MKIIWPHLPSYYAWGYSTDPGLSAISAMPLSPNITHSVEIVLSLKNCCLGIGKALALQEAVSGPILGST